MDASLDTLDDRLSRLARQSWAAIKLRQLAADQGMVRGGPSCTPRCRWCDLDDRRAEASALAYDLAVANLHHPHRRGWMVCRTCSGSKRAARPPQSKAGCAPICPDCHGYGWQGARDGLHVMPDGVYANPVAVYRTNAWSTP